MSLRIETVHEPVVTATSVGELAREVSYEHIEDETADRVLTLEYDEMVVISGDLEAFAHNVWQAVFGETPAHPDQPTAT